MQAVRNWTAFAVPNGQIVYRGRYYFAWSRGHFVGAYDSLDDAVESLTFRNGARATDPAGKLGLQFYGRS
jgi:hypothetical protein